MVILVTSCQDDHKNAETKISKAVAEELEAVVIEEEGKIGPTINEIDTTDLREPEYNANSIHEEFIVKSTIYTKDSLGELDGGHTTYYTNGFYEKGQTLDEFGCGMYSGMFYLYDSADRLLRTTNYDNWLQNNADGCHETMHDIYVTDFFADGKVKSKKVIQSCYECEEWNAGIWQEFDSLGNLLSEKDYGWKYKKK